jgi:filamentous hemagglutinin family protein
MKKFQQFAFQRRLVTVAVAACFAGRFAYANPLGPALVSGQASFASQGNLLSVVNTPGAIINWQQFSIGAAETTRFIQQSAASSVLNRVVGVDPSAILGSLQSNGRVFLVNPNGVLFGANARVDVAGLVASTLNISNEDFRAGRMNFAANPALASPVVNQGNISAAAGGRVYLIGAAVDNQGVINAPGGDIVLAAGAAVRVAEGGAPRLQVEISAPADRALNLSEAAYGSRGIYAGLVRNSGVITANSVTQTADGRIVLKSSGDVTQLAGGSISAGGVTAGRVEIDAGGNADIGGAVAANGDSGAGGAVSLKALIDATLQPGSRVSASGSSGGEIAVVAGGTASAYGTIDAQGFSGVGGQVAVLGNLTGLFDGARVDTAGATGGGGIRIGGDQHGGFIFSGGEFLPNSRRTFVGTGAQLNADAVVTGDGGKVVVWADDITRFYGAVSARGGVNGGNGGFAEISGKRLLDFAGRADLGAAYGAGGVLLFDPLNITLSTAAPLNTSGFVPPGDQTEAWNDNPAASSVFNVNAGGSFAGVAAGTTVTLEATNNITVANAFNLSTATGAANVSLNLRAGNNIVLTAGITASGSGALTLAADADFSGSGGAAADGVGAISGAGVLTQAAGTLTLSAGSGITANTAAPALAVANTTSGNVAITDSRAGALSLAGVTQSGGNFTLTHTTGAISQTAAITVAGTSAFSAGANAITLTNTGNDFTAAVGLTNSGANNVSVADMNALVLGTVNVGSGTLGIQSNGALTQTGSIVQAAGAGAVTINAGAGSVTLTNAANNFIGALSVTNTGANDVALRDANTLVLGAVNVGSGTLGIQSAGALTQTGALTQATGAGAVTINAGAGAITLTNTGNDFVGDVSLTNSGANAVALRDAGTLQLGTVSVGTGTLSLQSAGALTQTGSIVQSAGAGAVTINAGAGAITLTNTGNDFTGAVGLTNTGANNVAIVDANALTLGTSSLGTGTLSLQSSGALTQTGALVQAAGAGAVTINAGAAPITLTNAGNDFVGDVSLTNSGANAVALRDAGTLQLGTVNIGTGTLSLQSAGALTQTGSIVQAAGAGAVTINAGAGAITLTNTGNDFTGAVGLTNTGANNVAIVDANALVLGTSSVGSGTLSLQSSGALTQTGALVQAAGAGAVTISAGAAPITLTNAANNFIGAVSLTNTGSNNVAVRDANALVLGTVNVGSGTLGIQSAGALTQTGSIVQAAGAGAVTINAGAGAITLTNTGNDFTGAVGLTNTGANNVAIVDANALVLGASSVGSGTLSLQSNGALTQAGAITQAAGAGAVTVNAGAGAITLTNAGNDFVGDVALTNTGNNNLSITDANGLQLGNVSMTAAGTGTLTVAALNGSITQAGGSSISSGTGAASFSATAGAISLGNVNNDFRGTTALTNSGNNDIVIADTTGIVLGNVTMTAAGSGALAVTTNGAITQAGATTVSTGTGLSVFNSGAAGAQINLSNATNDFRGAVALNNVGANNVAIRDANALVLAASSVGSGTLTVTATGANSITQTGAITQAAGAGIASFSTGAGAITLTQANEFTGAVAVTNTGGDVSIADSSGLILGTLSMANLANTLSVVANGAITQSGVTTITSGTGAVNFNAGANALALTNANDFRGALSVTNTGANDVSLRDANTLLLGTVNVGSGMLGIQSAGALTQTGAITQAAGAGAVTINAGAGAITLTNTGNDFVGDVSLTNSGANAVALRDSNVLQLGTVNVGTGTLSLQSAGALTQAGSIVQSAGAGAVTLNAGAGPITLTNAGNNFIGAVSLTNSGANDVAITDANALVLGTSSVGSGALTVTATGANNITQTGALVQAAGAGTASFSTGAGAVTLTNAGNDFTGAVAVTNNGGNVAVTDSNALVLGTLSMANAANTLAVVSNGALTQAGVTTLTTGTGAVSFNSGAAGGAITLGNANDFRGAVAVTTVGAGGHIALTDMNALQLGTVSMANAASTLAVAAGGALTQSGVTTITSGTGAVSFDAGANAITLTNANDFRGGVSLANSGANNVAVRDANTLVLGTVNVGSGTLGIQSAGALTQTGSIVQATGAGAVTINAGAGAITLTNTGNDFTGAVGLTNTGANNVAIVDANALTLGSSSLGTGTLGISTAGNLTGSGAIVQAAAAGAVSITARAAGTDIQLDTQANNFSGAVNFLTAGGSYHDIGLRNVNAAATLSVLPAGLNNLSIVFNSAAVNLPATTLTGNLGVTAGGAITDGGNLVVSGSTTLAAGANNITLNNANNFTGAVAVTSGNNVTLNDINGLAIGASTIGGNLAITAAGNVDFAGVAGVGGTLNVNTGGGAGATITQSAGTLAVTGITTLAAGAGNNITLNSTGNNFGTVIVSNGNNVTLIDANALTLGASTLGSLTAQTLAGDLSLAGTINATGAGDAIVLATAGRFLNAGAFALNPGGGRYLVWSANPNPFGGGTPDNRGGLGYNFKQYNASYGVTAVAGSGNGFLYTLAPTVTPGLTGTVSKTYDGSTAATLTGANYTVSGAVDGDLITLNNPLSGNFDNANAGTGKNVNVSGIALASAANGAATVYGYQMAAATANANIGTVGKANLTVSTANVIKTYDATVAAPGAAATVTSGTLYANASNGGVTDSLAGGTFAFVNANAGSNKTVTVGGVMVNDGNGGNNYNVTLANNITSTINQAALALNAVTESKLYDGGTSAVATPVAVGLAGGDSVNLLTQSFAGKHVLGTNGSTLNVNAGYVVNDGNGGNNYMVTLNPATGTITPKGLTLSAVSDTKTYDGGTASAGVPNTGGLVGGDTVSLLTQSFASKNVLGANASTLNVNGGYVVNDGNSGSNYMVTLNSATGTITPKSLLLSAVTDSRAYNGSAGSAAAPNAGGLVGGDTVSLLTQSFASKNVLGANGSTLNVDAGYVVNDGNGGNNYAVSLNSATGTITPKSLLLSAVTDSRIYDGSVGSAGTPNTAGLVGGDTVGLLTQSFASKNVLGVNGSTLNVDAGYAVNDGNGGSNYAVTLNSAAGTITPKNLLLSALTDSKTYDGGVGSAGAPNSGGLVGGDTVSLLMQSFASKNVLGVNGSTLNVNAGYVVNDGNGGNNYMVTLNPATGTITPKGLTLSAVSDTKTYDGGTASAGVPNTGGLVGGDTVGLLTQSFASKNVLGANGSTLNVNGGYLLNDGNGGGNYAVTLNSAMGTITPAPLSIAANDAARGFGVANPPFTATYTGLLGADTPLALSGTLSFATPATPASPLGVYPIVPSGQTATNYLISYINGALTVTAPAAGAPMVSVPAPAQQSALQMLGLKSAAESWSDCVGGGKASGGGGVASSAQQACGGGPRGVELPRPGGL